MNPLKFHEIMLELLKLREHYNMDPFIEKLYEALSGVNSPFLDGSNMTNKQKEAISTMIDYYQQKEEYEKCAVLKRMVEDSSKVKDD